MVSKEKTKKFSRCGSNQKLLIFLLLAPFGWELVTQIEIPQRWWEDYYTLLLGAVIGGMYVSISASVEKENKSKEGGG